MRAVAMRDRQLVLDTLPDPKPRAGQVLVRTLACGICGSDLHMLQHAERMNEVTRRAGRPVTMDLTRDVVMGHEFCAEILDYGPDTQRKLPVGTRVCSPPIAFGPQGFGSVGYSNDYPGGYGELMLLSEPLLLEVPSGLATRAAALTEPLAVGEHAVEMARLEGGEVPLVIGCGPVGLAVICSLKARGIGPVVAADFSPRRRALAEQLGADRVVDPAQHSPYTEWRQVAQSGPAPGEVPPFGEWMGQPARRPCVLFECVGVPGVLQQAFEGVPRSTRIVVVGVCMETDPIESIFAVHKEINLQFVFGYSVEEFKRTLSQLSEGALRAEPMITGRVGLEQVPEAFAALANPEEHAKLLVEFSKR